jgi:RNA polymerase sigma-70 factor (ECF subfamily)
LTFEAFGGLHDRVWLGFARTQVGGQGDAAHLVVQAMVEHLQQNWQLALRQEDTAAYAWRLLKEHIAVWLAAQSQPVIVQTTALDEVIDWFCHRARLGPVDLPERIALLAAILELPERQRDTMILTYCLDQDDSATAGYLGTPAAMLRSQRRQARRRLARAIGRLELAELEDDE